MDREQQQAFFQSVLDALLRQQRPMDSSFPMAGPTYSQMPQQQPTYGLLDPRIEWSLKGTNPLKGEYGFKVRMDY